MPDAIKPLAERMRPRTFDEFVGQQEIVGADKPLRQILADKSSLLPSIILWGPPGSGKTTLAFIIAQATGFEFITFSAVTSGIKEIKEVMERARYNRDIHKKNTILFVDEIHRFNKAQQDAFLPYIEKGTITMIGATTENPSFELNSALLSRCRVFVLRQLTNDEIILILRAALKDEQRGLGKYNVHIDNEVAKYIVNIANGDARAGLTLLDIAVQSTKPRLRPGGTTAGEPASEGVRVITKETVESAAQRKVMLYDQAGEEHYNIISAFHKSLRGSDPDASLYWLGRMLEAGEDPFYVARRMVRFASEDIGNADPQALLVAVAAKEAVDFVGMPEADNALAQAAIYLATAPKSNSVYAAYNKVKQDVKSTFNEPVPLHLRNPVTDLMSELGYGDNYKYPHDFPYHFVKQQYLPEGINGKKYYQPGDLGFEKEIKKRMEFWEKLKQKPSE
ncbi:MAG: replication-associated recombination protein A [Planctomycetes bacterium]|nr:replication-associated recombination protein A [Planctomycetota bacterium]